jgi:phosphoglycerate dehydrogenase-like enzyme
MRVIYDPEPRATDEILSAEEEQRFRTEHKVIEWSGEDRDAFYDRYLPEAEVLISQQPMGRDRLDLAPQLRAIFNVETKFLPNIDYEECFRRGIHVLAPGAVFAQPVAEMALGMAISLARNIHGEHAAFLDGEEKWLFEGQPRGGAADRLDGRHHRLRRSRTGAAPAARAISARVQVYDPWLPHGHLRRLGVEPASLEQVMRENRFIFVMAAITTENQHMIGAQALSWMQPNANLLILSRAGAADFGALAEAAAAGRVRVATDVFPVEPAPKNDPIRRVPNILFSPHRAGALTLALREIGTRVLEDMDLISRGLAPVSCRRAERETVARFRSMPVKKS